MTEDQLCQYKEDEMYRLSCGQSRNHNCATCKIWNGKGSGNFICDEHRCFYEFSFIRFIKAVFKWI